MPGFGVGLMWVWCAFDLGLIDFRPGYIQLQPRTQISSQQEPLKSRGFANGKQEYSCCRKDKAVIKLAFQLSLKEHNRADLNCSNGSGRKKNSEATIN
jgi:hypothetical protein